MSDSAHSVLILGATSDIGRALAHEYAAAGAPLVLAARDTSRLAEERDDLVARYDVEVSTHALDILAADNHERLLAALDPLPATTICVIGLMEPQRELERDVDRAERVLQSNFNGPVRLLARIANTYEQRGAGTIIAASSVAGDRGRATNYVYGSAKAGMTAWLSGLRNRLQGSGVQVLTVKPGFVRTRMTEGMDLPGALTASPAEVAGAVRRAQLKGRDVIYCRWLWRPIMWIIRAIPERVFKRLSI